MASTKIVLDTRYQKKDGTFALKIELNHAGKTDYFPLRIYLRDDQWENNLVVNHKLQKHYNNVISKRKIQIDDILLDLERTGQLYVVSGKKLKDLIERKRTGGYNPQKVYFCEFAQQYIDKKAKNRTREIYTTTLNKVVAFAGKDLLFPQINIKWLNDFDAFMQEDTPSINARAIDLRNIRAIFNAAIDEEIISQDIYPFRKFKIKTQETQKKDLLLNQIRGIRDETDPELKMTADIFMLIYYLSGINIVDLLNIKEVENSRINFYRAKTKRLYSIKVEPEAQEIIDKAVSATNDVAKELRERYRSQTPEFRAMFHKMLEEQGLDPFEWELILRSDCPVSLE